MLDVIKQIFTRHKMKLVLFFTLSGVFTLLLFPYGDLSDKATTEIAGMTNNTVYLQFDDISFTMLPQPAIKMSHVMAEVPQLPDLSLSAVSVAPSPLALIRGAFGGRIYAEGLFNGNLDASIAKSKKIPEDGAMAATVEYDNFDIKELFKALQTAQRLPMTASGRGQLKASVDFDPTMKNQPDGDFDMQAQQIQVPAFSVPVASFGGTLPVPGLSLSKLLLKGQIKNGKLVLKDTAFGAPKDDLFGKVTGELDVRFQPGNGQMSFGFYNLAVDLNLTDEFQSQLGSYMGILDGFLGQYKTKNLTGVRYAFRIQGNSFQDPNPQFSPL